MECCRRKRVRAGICMFLLVVFMGSTAVFMSDWNEAEKSEKARFRAEEMAEMELEEMELAEMELAEMELAEPSEAETTETAEMQPEADVKVGIEQEPYYGNYYTKKLKNMDFEELQKLNPDILGWIMVPDSKLSYPLLQGADNDYYLNHTWEYERTTSGSIFLEHLCHGDLKDYNTLVYGHRMRDRSMFGNLIYYSDADYLEEHPYIYIADSHGCYTYRVFAVYEADIAAETFRIGDFDQKARERYIDWSLRHSVVETGVEPTVNDRILTLVTCAGGGYDTRWVVQAYFVGADSNEREERKSDYCSQSPP